MKLIAALALLCCSVHSAESGRVAGAILRERLRVDDAHQSAAQIIAAATERFAGYYMDVDTRDDVKRLDRAFRAFGRAVRRKARQDESSGVDKLDGVGAIGEAKRADPVDVVQPPISNRGVVFSSGLDWLTMSAPGISGNEWSEIRKSLDWLKFEDKDAVFGHGYNMRACAGYGGIGSRAREGLLDGAVNLPGEALRYLSAFGVANLDTLKYLRSTAGAHLTRLDAAIDVFSHRVKVPVWWEKIKAKQYASRSRGKPKMRGDVDGVETIYIGSNKSPRQLRIYDKSM